MALSLYIFFLLPIKLNLTETVHSRVNICKLVFFVVVLHLWLMTLYMTLTHRVLLKVDETKKKQVDKLRGVLEPFHANKMTRANWKSKNSLPVWKGLWEIESQNIIRLEFSWKTRFEVSLFHLYFASTSIEGVYYDYTVRCTAATKKIELFIKYERC